MKKPLKEEEESLSFSGDQLEIGKNQHTVSSSKRQKRGKKKAYLSNKMKKAEELSLCYLLPCKKRKEVIVASG